VQIFPLTEAKARFSAIVERLILMKDTVVIMRRNRPVAVLVPYDDWARLHPGANAGLGSVNPPDEDLDAEIDEILAEIYTARRKSKSRRVRF
jgi:prevent-host-death family protein